MSEEGNERSRQTGAVLTDGQRLAMEAVKAGEASFLSTLDRYCHPGRETSLARTKAEEAAMWAIRGITAGTTPRGG